MERHERFDVFEDYGRYDDMAFPYFREEFEDEYITHLPNALDSEEDFWEEPFSTNDDFFDYDPFFWSVTSDEECKRMDELMTETNAVANAQDHEFIKLETAPLRHHKKKGWKNGRL